ncbi:hypothetical protein [Nostoc sp.]
MLATGRFNSVDEGIASLEKKEGIDSETFVNQLLTQLKQAKEA